MRLPYVVWMKNSSVLSEAEEGLIKTCCVSPFKLPCEMRCEESSLLFARREDVLWVSFKASQ